MKYEIIKKQVIGSDISLGTYDEFIKYFFEIAQRRKSSYVCVANVHMLIEGFKDPVFQKIINEADLATPDGMPISKALGWLYGIRQDRVAGMDIMPDLMQKCEKHNLSIYLYGSTDDILADIKLKAENEFPSLNICGMYSPPFRDIDADEHKRILRRINDANPDFVFVALGCPKQEKWMAQQKGHINSCMIGLGGAFEVYAGRKKRAPLWMQRGSLEWFYRLLNDPRRLWKRYLYTNSFFVILLLKQLIQTRTVKMFKKN